MARQETDVGNLVGMIERGELRLPEMQRRYVWTSTRVRDLLDSLYRKYPSGTILVWETDGEHSTRDLQVDQDSSAFTTQKLLLDGQQRLTSLSAVIRGKPVKVRNRQRAIDIAFNLDHPEGPPVDVLEVNDDAGAEENGDSGDIQENGDATEIDEEADSESVMDKLNRRVFAVASSQLLARPNWISVSEVFKGDKADWDFLETLVESPKDPKFRMYSDRLNRLRAIKNYPYVMEILDRNLSYEEVAEIFVRVNSLGAKLRGSDLALAQITARWPGSLTLFESFAADCETSSKYLIETGLLVRLLVVFATHQCRFNTVASIGVERMKRAWDEAKKGVEYAISFLRSNAGIEGMSLLASPYYLIPLAVFGHVRDYKISPQEQSQMLRWLFCSNARGHYSGSSESTLDADLKILYEGGDFGGLVSALNQKFARLNVQPDDLVGRGQRSALFSLAYLALKHAGAKDWETGIGLSLSHQGHSHVVEYHHIFPKSLLQKEKYEKAEINEIANMAFISGRANRNISNKRPLDYLPGVIKSRGSMALELQCITQDAALHDLGSYRAFLADRRQRLADVINNFIETAVKNGQATGIPIGVANAGHTDSQ